MKSKLILAILLMFAIGAKAQTEKGKNLIGLNAAYSSNETNDLRSETTKSEANFGLSYGRFFWKDVAIGIKVSYHTGKSFVPSNYLYTTPSPGALGFAYTDTRQNYLSIHPYFRHYVGLSEKFKIYGELTAGIGFGTQSNEYISPNRSSRSGDYLLYQAEANAGIVFFPTKKIGIELGVNLASYAHATADYPSSTNEKTVNFSGLNFVKPTIGINFHF